MSKLIMCPSGKHYYNPEKFSSCPYCQQKSYLDGGSDITGGYIEQNGNDISGERRTLPLKMVRDRVSGTTAKTGEQKDDDGKTQGYFAWKADKKEPFMEKESDPVVGWLVCVKGNNYGKSFDLHSGRNFIGRSSEMHICLKGDDSVSRARHAIITYEPRARKFFAQPGDSQQLFYVNDDVVLTSVELGNKDVISVGKSRLVFVPFCDQVYGWEKDQDASENTAYENK